MMEAARALLPHTETPAYDREQRLYDDTTTWLAEVLDGSMRTPFEYRFDGSELYAQDGSRLRPIFLTAVKDAEQLAAQEPHMAFELRRRIIEQDEYRAMLAVAAGELPNTMVVVSDFPPELMAADHDIGGYNVRRKQTMLRVITKGQDGHLLMRSQSLDNSDRRALEAMYQALGFQAQAGELLGQRMHLELTSEDQELLIDQLMGVYDRSLQARYGGEWYAGRQDARRINTYHFVRQQQDLLQAFMNVKDMYDTEDLLLDLAAEMVRRYERNDTLYDLRPVERSTLTDEAAVRAALLHMQQSGQQARAEGRTFSGCGLSVRAKAGRLSAYEELAENGYGNKSLEGGSEEQDTVPSVLRCVNCKANVPKKDVVKENSWCCPKCKYEVDICSGKVICAGKKA